jgi:hypothetical protein
MTTKPDYESYRATLEVKLQPTRIRSTLAFAGLYQITHELIKESVMDELRNFYFAGIDETGILVDEPRYAAEVLALDPKRRKMRGSLLWPVKSGAITQAQADRLDEIYDHRHELTHELAKYIVDPAHEPDMRLFTDAVEILRDVLRYWTLVEIEIGSFGDHGVVDVDDVVPGRLLLLRTCIAAYVDGLPHTG